MNLLVAKRSGPITVSEEIALVKEALSDPGYKAGMNVLCDMTEAEYDWSLEDIDRYRNFVRSHLGTLGTSKWALLTKGGATHASGKLYILLHGLRPGTLQVRLFPNRFDAIKWLGSAD
jgi:hypothetical protein